MEILSIQLDNIDLNRHVIYVPKAKAGTREQPITTRLAEFLAKHFKTTKVDQKCLFPARTSQTGHTINIERSFRRVVKAADLDVKQVVRHTLRHTAITHLVQAGVDLPTVKRISGHKTLQMVERYSHQNGAHNIRIRIAGHPVGGKGASHFLTRYTLSKWGLELWKYDRLGGRTTAQVCLLSLIKKNSMALHAVMSDLINHMETEDKKHKERFVKDLLEKLFQNATYFSIKVFEGVSGRNPMGMAGLTPIKDIIEKFCSSLRNRSVHFEESGFVFHDIPKLKYALNKFERYLGGDESQNEDDAYILATFIQVGLKKLADIAKEIDEGYKSRGQIGLEKLHDYTESTPKVK